jgi:hypothetical protein
MQKTCTTKTDTMALTIAAAAAKGNKDSNIFERVDVEVGEQSQKTCMTKTDREGQEQEGNVK